MHRLAPPNTSETVTALRLAARETGRECAWSHDGRFYFELGDGWLLALSPDSAGRFRLGACYGATEVATLWCSARDLGRLAALVRGLGAEIAALAA